MFKWLFGKKASREIIINAEPLETRVVLVEKGKVEEFQVEHTTDERIVGSIYKGRIQNLEHDLQAAFVDIGLRKNAFLHYWDMFLDISSMDEDEILSRIDRRSLPRQRRITPQEVERLFPPGSEIVVQVVKGMIGTKGPRVTAVLSIPGRYLVLMPGSLLRGISKKIEDEAERKRLRKILDTIHISKDCGIIVRTAATNARKRDIIEEAHRLQQKWDELKRKIAETPAPACIYQEPDVIERVIRDWLTGDVDRIVVDSKEVYERLKQITSTMGARGKVKIQLYDGDLPIFEHYKIEQQLENVFSNKIMLESGGYIVIEETEALTTVDVNSGRYKGEGSQEDAILQINLEAAEEIARQLRLRNIGGLLVIDFIDMRSRKSQNTVYRAFKEALKRDRAKTNVLPISSLGLMEMTRQRSDESIESSSHMPCPYCRGRSTVKSPLQISVELQRRLTTILRKSKKSDEKKALQAVVHPAVLERLKREDEQYLLDIEAKYNAQLTFKSDPNRHIECFSILDPATGEILYSNEEK